MCCMMKVEILTFLCEYLLFADWLSYSMVPIPQQIFFLFFWPLRRRGLFVFGQISCDPFVRYTEVIFCFQHSWSLTVMVFE